MAKLVLIFIISVLASSQTWSEEKVYSKKEFEIELDKRVREKVVERLEKVQISNLSKYSRELLDKEIELEKREKQIVEKEKQFSRTENEFTKKVKSFEETQKKFIGCIDKNKKEKDERVAKVVQMIANMKPVKAAEVLSVQDTDLAVAIIGRLDPKKASKILNLLDKEISARLQKQYLNMQQ